MPWGIYLFQLMSKAPRLYFSSLLCGPPWAECETWPAGGVCRSRGPLVVLCPLTGPGDSPGRAGERGGACGVAALGRPGACCRAARRGRSLRFWAGGCSDASCPRFSVTRVCEDGGAGADGRAAGPDCG